MKLPDQRLLLFSDNESVAVRPVEYSYIYWPGAGAPTLFVYSLTNPLSVENPKRIQSKPAIYTFGH